MSQTKQWSLDKLVLEGDMKFGFTRRNRCTTCRVVNNPYRKDLYIISFSNQTDTWTIFAEN